MQLLPRSVIITALCLVPLATALTGTPASSALPALPASVQIDKGAGGLERLKIQAREGEAHLYLQGAHISHFQPKDEKPVIWVSKNSAFSGGRPGKPIRGGVPIVFPWFADNLPYKGAPGHGIARIFPWTLISCSELPDGRVRAVLNLKSDEETRARYPHDFLLEFVVTVGATLEMSLSATNTGSNSFVFEEALHTYFAVSDVRRVAIAGLEGAPYIDKVDAFKRKTGETAALRITAETDRIYPNNTATVIVTDPDWNRRIVISKTGSNSTVVWNPWIAKGASLTDLAGQQWPFMLCVETSNVGDNSLTLAPGKRHTMSATISLSRP